jgi:hypothetical protein
MLEPLSKLCDVVFNGRPAESTRRRKSGVTIEALVKRGTSVILFKGRLYEITVKPKKVERD